MQKISGLEGLTHREEQVFYLLAQGMKKRAVAEKLCICESTVRTYTPLIYQKLNLHSQAELIIFYYEKLLEGRV